MRINKDSGKSLGHILLQIVVLEGLTVQEFAETTKFRVSLRIL